MAARAPVRIRGSSGRLGPRRGAVGGKRARGECGTRRVLGFVRFSKNYQMYNSEEMRPEENADLGAVDLRLEVVVEAEPLEEVDAPVCAQVPPGREAEHWKATSTKVEEEQLLLPAEVYSSQRERRLTRLQQESLAAGGHTEQKLRVKPVEAEKPVLQSACRLVDSGCLPHSIIRLKTNSLGIMAGDAPELPERYLRQASTPQHRHGRKATPSTGLIQNERVTPGRPFPSGVCLLDCGESYPPPPALGLAQQRITITSPNVLENSPFKVERFEHASMMSQQERLEQIARANFGLQSPDNPYSGAIRSSSPNLAASPLLVKIQSSPSQRSQRRVREHSNPFREVLTCPMNSGRWKQDEHHRFLEALRLYGREWKQVQLHVATRTSTQARSHAQKFLGKLDKRNITLQEFLDKYFERPDELEDDFFSGVSDNELLPPSRRRPELDVDEEQEEEEEPEDLRPKLPRPAPLPGSSEAVVAGSSLRQIKINGYTLNAMATPNEEIEDDIELPPPVELKKSKSRRESDKVSDAYEGDDEFDVVSPPIPRREKRRKGRPRKESNNKIILHAPGGVLEATSPSPKQPPQTTPKFLPPNSTPPPPAPKPHPSPPPPQQHSQPAQSFFNYSPLLDPYNNPNFVNPYETETQLAPRKSSEMASSQNPYFEDAPPTPWAQPWSQPPYLAPKAEVKVPSPQISAVPPIDPRFAQFQPPPPPPPPPDFQNYLGFDGMANEQAAASLQQFEPPTMMGGTSMAAMMYQQLNRDAYDMYEINEGGYEGAQGGNYYYGQGQVQQYMGAAQAAGGTEEMASPRNRTDSMPEAPPNYDRILKRAGLQRFDTSEQGSLANEESIGPQRFNLNFDMSAASKFRKQNDEQVAARD